MTGRADHQEPSSRLGPRTRLRAFVLLAITVAGLYICYLLTLPFLPALTWAVALAILFAPAHRRVEAKVRNPNLAATISVLAIGLIVVAPAIFLSERLFAEAAQGTVTLQEKLVSGEWRRAVGGHVVLAKLVQLIDQLNLPAVIGNVTAWLTATSASLVREWVLQLITAVLTFYLLFYFLRDRKLAVDWLLEISPLSEVEMSRLFERLAATVQATLYGTVAIAAVQGTLGGLIFWWLGLPAPALWGLVMGLLAIVPVLGAFVVWVPTALFLALDGNWGKALILTAWGAVVVGGIDNLLYPMLVGNRLKLHTIPALISIVGGVILFGPSGLLLGPLALTTTVFFLEIWRIRATGREPMP